MEQKQFKPMLAYTIEDTSKLSYPVLASQKLDGIRAVVIDGVVMSRSMKPIRSKLVQELFGKVEYDGFDGELLYGPWYAENVFNLTTQVVMSTELKSEFNKDELRFAVFDDITAHESAYTIRLDGLERRLHECDSPQISYVEQTVVRNECALLALEEGYLTAGYEGLMVRSILGRYKQGRSTAKEGIIGKLKRFNQDEGLIIGFEEKMTNTNEAKKNELGRTQRSQAQEGMVGAGTLGAFVCTCEGITFTCGSGLNDAMRDEIWNNREAYLGKYITFTHFAVGRKDSFRFPIFKGFRDVEDMS